jgi:hypothetical protein
MAKHSPPPSSASGRPTGGPAHEFPLAGEEPEAPATRPIAPAEEVAREMGLTPATIEEFEAEYGPALPPDDEL